MKKLLLTAVAAVALSGALFADCPAINRCETYIIWGSFGGIPYPICWATLCEEVYPLSDNLGVCPSQ